VAQAGAESARAIVDAGRYMTLATADADGTPWASPVWYAPSGYAELLWVSDPDARHSRNLAARPEVSIVIFDSHVTPGEGQAVYMAGRAGLAGDVEAGLRAFSARSVEQGLGEWTRERLGDRLRLYRAAVAEHWMLGDERDERVRVDPLTLDTPKGA
jgi:nitroimidazol reductase NimA-like FMN-containing flavoprotein (pyridoxamine 5'-phosphate oxidase superfamily)